MWPGELFFNRPKIGVLQPPQPVLSNQSLARPSRPPKRIGLSRVNWRTDNSISAKGTRACRSATNSPRARSKGQTRRGQHCTGYGRRYIWVGEPDGIHVEHAVYQGTRPLLAEAPTGSVGHGFGGHFGTAPGRSGRDGQVRLEAGVSTRYLVRHVRRSRPGWK